MRRFCISVFMLMLLFCSCTKRAAIQKIVIDDFNTSVFDTLRNERGIALSDVIVHNKTFIYIANNECSECISNFIDFNDILQESGICSDFNVIYIIYGCDKLAFDYYMNRDEVCIDSRIHVVNDSLDVFHEKVHRFYSNALFYIDEEMKVYYIRSFIPEYEWNITDIINVTKQSCSEQSSIAQ